MPQTILIIDNDELELDVFRSLLVEAGYGVLLTADGPQGILLYKTHRPSLVLLDSHLPSLSGKDVMRKICDFDRNAKVIFIR